MMYQVQSESRKMNQNCVLFSDAALNPHNIIFIAILYARCMKMHTNRKVTVFTNKQFFLKFFSRFIPFYS